MRSEENTSHQLTIDDEFEIMTNDKENRLPRRKVIKMLPAAGASAFMLPGVASADPGKKNPRGSSGKKMSRAEKATEAGYEWDESWIDDDSIGKSYEKSVDKSVSTESHTNCLDLMFSLSGIDFGIESCWSPCEVETTISAFDQSATRTLTCGEACESLSLNAGAAYVDVEYCVNWDDPSLSIYAEGCVWSITHWSCDTIDRTYYY